jgi:quinol monooxygenase YgiN
MYGTIAKLQSKPGAIDELSNIGDGRKPAGYIGSLVFKSDNDPNELWLVAIFKDKETYFANASSPEQEKEFTSLMKFLKGEPEWHDGEVVFDNYEHN